MSTTPLTMVVVVVLIAGLFAASITALYRRQLAAASFIAAAGLTVLHLAFIAIAWEAAATSETLPGIASLPTEVYDAPAWAAVAFLTTGIIGGIVHQIRRRRRREAIERYFENLLGLYEADED